jgi:DNA-binding PadR family transcriptional regulator
MPLNRLKELNTRECLWLYILRLLSDRPMHGYALREEISSRFGFRPGTVTSYKVLYLLSRSGYVKKEQKGRQKLYSITPAGRGALGKALEFYRERIALLGPAVKGRVC